MLSQNPRFKKKRKKGETTQDKEDKIGALSKLEFRPMQEAFRVPKKRKRGFHFRKT